MKETVENIINLLKNKRLPINTERELQVAIEQVFIESKIDYEREYRFDNKNIVDFFIYGIAVEVKIKGGKKAIYKQCERYCGFKETKALLLITNRSMGFPEAINGKDCYYYSLSTSWL